MNVKLFIGRWKNINKPSSFAFNLWQQSWAIYWGKCKSAAEIICPLVCFVFIWLKGHISFSHSHNLRAGREVNNKSCFSVPICIYYWVCAKTQQPADCAQWEFFSHANRVIERAKTSANSRQNKQNRNPPRAIFPLSLFAHSKHLTAQLGWKSAPSNESKKRAKKNHSTRGFRAKKKLYTGKFPLVREKLISISLFEHLPASRHVTGYKETTRKQKAQTFGPHCVKAACIYIHEMYKHKMRELISCACDVARRQGDESKHVRRLFKQSGRRSWLHVAN